MVTKSLLDVLEGTTVLYRHGVVHRYRIHDGAQKNRREMRVHKQIHQPHPGHCKAPCHAPRVGGLTANHRVRECNVVINMKIVAVIKFTDTVHQRHARQTPLCAPLSLSLIHI